MRFWKDALAPSWASLFGCRPSGLLGTQETLLRHYSPQIAPSGFSAVQPLSSQDAPALSHFLRVHYSSGISSRCRAEVSPERIQQGLEKDGWIVLVVRHLSAGNPLAGVLVSKSAGTFSWQGRSYPNIGLIDFFCVAKEYRKKGIGSFLLWEAVRICATQGRLIHFFLKEGWPLLSQPAIYSSRYIHRYTHQRNALLSQKVWRIDHALHSPIQLFQHQQWLSNQHQSIPFSIPKQLSGDIRIFRGYSDTHFIWIAIQNLFHRSLPEGLSIGEVIWVVGEAPREVKKQLVEEAIDRSGFEVVLMDSQIPHQTRSGWQNDTTFQWYCFNFEMGSYFLGEQPCFLF